MTIKEKILQFIETENSEPRVLFYELQEAIHRWSIERSLNRVDLANVDFWLEVPGDLNSTILDMINLHYSIFINMVSDNKITIEKGSILSIPSDLERAEYLLETNQEITP